MATNDEIIDKHTGGIETKDGFVCETCGAIFRTDYELLAHQGNPVIYTQEDMDEAKADERAKVQKEMLNGNLQVKPGTKLGDFLPQSEIRKLVEIVKKEIVEPSLNKVRTDTANQIFAELDAAAWQQIEPDKLKQFYKEFSEAKDEKAALEIAKKYSIIGFSAEKYDNVKKEYKVD